MPEIIPQVSLLMPDSVSPAAVAYDGGLFYAVNGLTPHVFVFAPDGAFIDRFDTVRPYRAARWNAATNSFCCLGSGCRSGIYTLDRRFEETSYTSLEPEEDGGESYICDAGFSEDGALIEVTKRKSLELYDRGGGYIDRAERAAEGEEFVKWASFGEKDAVCSVSDGIEMLTVDGEGISLPSCVKLKSFIPSGGTLCGAFCSGYIYTRTEDIYGEDGIKRRVFSPSGRFGGVRNARREGKCHKFL